MQRWSSVLLLVCACSRGTSSPAHPDGYEILELRYEGSANNVNYPELAEDLGFLAPIQLKYIGNNSTGGPHSIQAVVTGDIDFGSSFNGAVIKLVATKAPVRAVMTAYGTDELSFSGFYTLEASKTVSARDLIGKRVSLNTLGAHAEFALKEYLKRGGLTTEEARQVTLVQLPPLSGELALRNGQIDAASLSTILRDRALERGGIRLLFSDHQLFGSFNAGSYVMRERFIRENPKTVRKFVEATGKAIEWARSRPRQEVVERFESIIRKRKRNEDNTSVKYWQSVAIASKQGALRDQDFQLWIDWLVQSGQLRPGEVKPSDMYDPALQAYADLVH